jgi:two-component system LytT family response regulator
MRAVVVDDELLAGAHLREVLSSDSNVEVVAVCRSAREAREAVAAHDPDVLFLDIEMPGASGLELAREAEAAGRPLVVFVTAHERYALDAFDVAPVDYVLKPADSLRCRRATARVARILAARATAGVTAGRFAPRTAPAPAPTPRTAYLNRVFVKHDDRLLSIAVADIEYVEALGNYVKLRARGKMHVVRGSLSALESRLDPAVFIRTHRSYIVNVMHIRELVPVSHGDYMVVIESGARVPLSRVYRENLEVFVLAAPAAAESA